MRMHVFTKTDWRFIKYKIPESVAVYVPLTSFLSAKHMTEVVAAFFRAVQGHVDEENVSVRSSD